MPDYIQYLVFHSLQQERMPIRRNFMGADLYGHAGRKVSHVNAIVSIVRPPTHKARRVYCRDQ